MAKRGSIFRSLPAPRIGKSNFDLSHDHRTTFDMGYLVPILCEDTLPGDKWSMSFEPLVRAAAMLAPVMSRIDVRIDVFHVSNRIMWPSWERWFKNELINEPPYIIINDSTENQVKSHSLGGYMGLPAFDTLSNLTPLKVSAFPFCAYNMIWNEFYRHQHVQTELTDVLTNDDNTTEFLGAAVSAPQYRNWTHDYFTSANPFPVSGNAGVDIPITHQPNSTIARKVSDSTPLANEDIVTSSSGFLRGGGGQENVWIDSAHKAQIEDLRSAIKVQEWLEKLTRGGSRFREMLWNFFGVDNKDMRMQVPELIGSSVQSMRISEVLSTAETLDSLDATVNPVGQQSGHGISAGRTRRFHYSAKENGWIIAVLNVQPTPTYMNQGLEKKFTRQTLFEYYFPQFAHLGEEAILNKELYIDDTATVQEEVFGYQARYSDYRFKNNRVSGEFGSNLDFWTFARKFASTPVLNDAFIKADQDNRPFSIQDGADNMRAMVYNDIKVTRPIPRFATPKTGG